MNFADELMEVWIKEKKRLDEIDPEKQKDMYKAQLDRVNEIEKRMTDLAKTELEVEEKAACRDMDEALREQQMADERKANKHRNIIEILKIAVPVTGAFAMGLISMVWEKTEVGTSTSYKNSLRDLIKFK